MEPVSVTYLEKKNRGFEANVESYSILFDEHPSNGTSRPPNRLRRGLNAVSEAAEEVADVFQAVQGVHH